MNNGLGLFWAVVVVFLALATDSATAASENTAKPDRLQAVITGLPA